MTTRIMGFSRKSRATLVAMALSAALIAAALAPSAQAYTPDQVWQEFLPANTWSGYRYGTVLNHHHGSAWYAGSGTVGVCEQVQIYNGGWNGTIVSQICANNTATGGSLSPWNGYSKRIRIKNNSAFGHTIAGALYKP